MGKKLYIIPLVLLLFVIGCHHNRVTYKKGSGGKITKKSHDYFLWGLIPSEKKFKVKELCPGGSIQQIHSYFTVPNALFGICTLGIYSPKTLEVKCTAGGMKFKVVPIEGNNYYRLYSNVAKPVKDPTDIFLTEGVF